MGRIYRRAMQVVAYKGEPLESDGDFERLAKANPELTGREVQTLLQRQRNASILKGREAVIIRDMRVQFNVEKNIGSEPNKCDITVTNLARTTSTFLTTKPLRVQLAAGHDNVARYLFVGDLRDGRIVEQNTEVDAQLQLGDGDRAFRFGHVNRSYKRGTSVLTALRDAASGMGVQLPRNVERDAQLRKQFSSGVSLYGNAGDELTRLLAPYGYKWSIQNGSLQILADNEAREDRAWLIDDHAGLIGSPEWSTPTKTGETPKLTVHCALFPELTPGGKVQVASERVNGIFRIEKVTHAGDTDGEEWSTAIEVKKV
jgi:hypothetical protein